MTSSLNGMDGLSAAERADRHLAATGPGYGADIPSAADLKARGAADGMWKKVREDLERIDRAPNEEADDE